MTADDIINVLGPDMRQQPASNCVDTIVRTFLCKLNQGLVCLCSFCWQDGIPCCDVLVITRTWRRKHGEGPSEGSMPEV